MLANILRGGAVAMTAAVLLASGNSTTWSQARKDAPVPAPAATPAAPNLNAATVDVSGFRTAKFGMTENEVRAAIAKDFNVKGDAIKSETNRNEQTQILTIRVPEVLPGGGGSEVSYVFGFKTKKLIQVGLSWSKATDDKITAEQLFSNSTVLRSHFLAAGYKPDTVATNMPISGGLLMFRGSDASDRTTLLILQGTLSQPEQTQGGAAPAANTDQRVLTPTGLLLFYVADAKAPDVYRLPAGSF